MNGTTNFILSRMQAGRNSAMLSGEWHGAFGALVLSRVAAATTTLWLRPRGRGAQERPPNHPGTREAVTQTTGLRV
jgi:hypothetical protein